MPTATTSTFCRAGCLSPCAAPAEALLSSGAGALPAESRAGRVQLRRCCVRAGAAGHRVQCGCRARRAGRRRCCRRPAARVPVAPEVVDVLHAVVGRGRCCTFCKKSCRLSPDVGAEQVASESMQQVVAVVLEVEQGAEQLRHYTGCRVTLSNFSGLLCLSHVYRSRRRAGCRAAEALHRVPVA